MGGDFHYVHLGGEEYNVVLTVHRDCSPSNTNGTGFDAFATVGMGDGTETIGCSTGWKRSPPRCRGTNR